MFYHVPQNYNYNTSNLIICSVTRAFNIHCWGKTFTRSSKYHLYNVECNHI